MTGDLERRAKDVFDQLIGIEDPREREAARVDLCGDDEPLNERVQALLASDTQGTDVAARIVSKAGAVLAEEAALGAVGPYRLIRRIASGGMGEVYEARQSEPIERDVALKLIRPGFGSQEVVQRFEIERQVLGMMSHRFIAQVYDAGTAEDGRPYFAMELVDGEHVDRHCDQLQLDLESRLRLFLEVCEAVEHAHQKGIVHRDLKPSNVLVARQGERAVPKVIDFGIAKALQPVMSGAAETVVGSTLGTPDYMSPEQAGLARAVDTRTDVYSLGVLLYELLTSSRPFPPEAMRGLATDEARRVVREQVPEHASRRAAQLDAARLCGRARSADALARRLRGDLDWICACALEKDPQDRYASVGDMAHDIRRHLEAQPIEVGPPSPAYRARKFVARHRVGVGLAALLLLGILGTVSGLALGLRQARTAERAASQEAERALATSRFLGQIVSEADARALGEAIFAELLESVGDDLGAAAEADLESLTANVNRPDMAREVLSTVVLDRAVETAATTFAGDALAHGRVLRTLARAYVRLSRTERAEQVARAAVERLEHAGGLLDRETLGARSDLANVLRRQRKLDEALVLHLDVLDARSRSFGELDRDTLGSLTNLGTLHSHRREYQAADRYYSRALAGKEQLHGRNAPEVVRMLYAVGSTAARLLDHDRGRSLLARAVELQSEQLGSDHPTTVESRSKLSDILAEMGRFDEALAMRRQVLAVRRAALGEDHVSTLLDRDLEAWLLGQTGRFEEVEEIASQLVERYRAQLGADHPYLGAAHLTRGWALAHLGRFRESNEAVGHGIDVLERALPEGSPEMRPARDIEALLAYRSGALDRAVRLSESIVAELGPGVPGDGLTNLNLERRLAQILLDRGAERDLERAASMLERLTVAYRGSLGPDHYQTLRTRSLELHARFLRLVRSESSSSEERDRVVADMRHTVDQLEEVFGAGSYRMADPAVRLGVMLASDGMTDAAPWIARARRLDPVHPLLVEQRVAAAR